MVHVMMRVMLLLDRIMFVNVTQVTVATNVR